MKLNGTAILITLIVGSGVAQQRLTDLASESKRCAWNSVSANHSPGFAGTGSQRGRVNVDLLQTMSRPKRSRCDMFALEWLPTTPGRRAFSDRFSGAEFLELAAAAKPGEATTGAKPAQTQAQDQGATEAQELAKKLSNPVASLISLPLQSNFDFGLGSGSGWRYTLNVQPVIPIKLSEEWNLISRTIVPIVHQGNVTGPGASQSGLGDITQSLFFSPNKTEPLIWAVGPVFLIPTATDAALGTQKWGVGPTVLALKQKNGWTYGLLANHIWSVAGRANRSEVSSTFLQPFLSYSTKDAWTYSINTESTYDWVRNSWLVPINPFISKLVRFGKQPVSFGGGVKCWAVSPAGGPDNCSIRIVVTALFPKR
jgi:hypothetical protein